MRSLAIANQKGGVGKTTTAVHLGHGLALAGARVLLMDMDPQGNATLAVQAMEAENAEEGEPFGWFRQLAENLWILPSPGAEKNVSRSARIEMDALLGLVAQVRGRMDWLLADCPPRMDQWGWAGLRLCDEVLIPLQAEFFAMHGLSRMMQTLEEAAAEYPGHGELFGVLVTMLDTQEAVAGEVLMDLRANLDSRLLQTVILRDAHLIEAASHGKTLFDYEPRSKGAHCYAELVREVMHGRASTR